MSADLSNLKAALNPEQYEAVMATDGAILIIAGAGSGKTRVITYRIAHMLDMGIPQSQILALTFTNKAAREMEMRIRELTGKKLQNLTVSTFHAFGVRILRHDIPRLGWRENFSIYDETDRAALIKESAQEALKADGGGCGADVAASLDLYKTGVMVSDIKTGRRTFSDIRNDTERRFYKTLYALYQDGLRLYNAVDFDDLIMLPIRLFKEYPDVLARYRERYRYIMVDEFQDTSHQQYELMRLLADTNVAVVGDDDQSIYSWRGADYQNIRNFERDFPGMKEIRLEQNYRSTGTIVAAANGVISHNTNRKEKMLWSGKGSGRPIELYMPDNDIAEAQFIIESIQGICAEEKRRYDDFCVLMRANTQSRVLEEEFLAANIPYSMSGGTSFFQRKEIKDIISYLRVIANNDDDVNLLRIINTPRRGIGRAAIEELNRVASALRCPLWKAMQAALAAREEEQEAHFSDAALSGFAALVSLVESHKTMLGGRGLAKKVRALVDAVRYEDYVIGENQKSEKAARFKLLNIESLINSMQVWEEHPSTEDPTLYAYLNRITLLSRDALSDDSGTGKVSLMTIHAAKGLEFPVVFIAGAEEGIIPHARAVEEGGDNAVQEERRLFYVAITRAHDKLFISACRHRRRMQATVSCEPSRFLDEIPPNLVEYHEPPKAVSAETAQDFFANMRKGFMKPIVPGFTTRRR